MISPEHEVVRFFEVILVFYVSGELLDSLFVTIVNELGISKFEKIYLPDILRHLKRLISFDALITKIR